MPVWTRVSEIAETWTRVSDDAPTPTPDTTPDAFTFTAVIGAEGETTYTSNTITLTGIDADVELVVTFDAGDLEGETGFSKNGEEFGLTATTGVLNDAFTVRLTTTATASALHEVTLTIGTVSGTYSVRNAAAGAYVPKLNFADPRNSQFVALLLEDF